MKPRQSSPKPPPASAQRTKRTLDRVLSKAGICSRTEAREWIARGRVKVNGKVQRDPENWVDIGRDTVLLDGKAVGEARKLYLLLYKPKGYLTTFKDPEGRPTVYRLLGDMSDWVFPVGRLDLDTSGLLIMTNDSAFAEQMTNPEYHVPKTYLVKASTFLDDDQLKLLRDGVELKDGRTRPAHVNRVRDSGGRTFLEITITEGRNRQVRRMVEALGGEALKLVRVAIGPVRIGRLQIGRFRPMTADEIRALTRFARRAARGGKAQD